MRCPHCRLPMGRVKGAPSLRECVRCEDRHSALTEGQRRVLGAISALAADGPPSSQAIGDSLGISRQAAKKHLDELERMGLIRDEPVLVRSGKWRVVTP
jgi:DNA-binding MarR family transcriptional regulator